MADNPSDHAYSSKICSSKREARSERMTTYFQKLALARQKLRRNYIFHLMLLSLSFLRLVLFRLLFLLSIVSLPASSSSIPPPPIPLPPPLLPSFASSFSSSSPPFLRLLACETAISVPSYEAADRVAAAVTAAVMQRIQWVAGAVLYSESFLARFLASVASA